MPPPTTTTTATTATTTATTTSARSSRLIMKLITSVSISKFIKSTAVLFILLSIVISKSSLVALSAAAAAATRSSFTNHHHLAGVLHQARADQQVLLPQPEALTAGQQQQQVKEYVALVGDEFTLDCSSAVNENGNQQTITIQEHEDSVVWVTPTSTFLFAKYSRDPRYSVGQQDISKLVIHHVQQTDDGMYSCQIQKPQDKHVKTFHRLTVVDKPHIEKIVISSQKQQQQQQQQQHYQQQKDITILELEQSSEQAISFTCVSITQPTPDYRWYKYQLPLKYNSGVRQEDEGWVIVSGTGQLDLIPTSDPVKDSTMYKCLANNTYGSDYRYVEVRIKGPPKILHGHEEGTGVHFAQDGINSFVLLTCRCRIYPMSSQHYWTKDGVRIPEDSYNSDRYEFVYNKASGDFGLDVLQNSTIMSDVEKMISWRRLHSQQMNILMSLKILHLTEEFFGKYSCHLLNQNGQDTHVHQVSGAPIDVKILSPQTSQHPDRYDLIWKVVTYMPVNNHTIYYRLANANYNQNNNNIDIRENDWKMINITNTNKVPYTLQLQSPSVVSMALDNAQVDSNSGEAAKQQDMTQFHQRLGELNKGTMYEVKVVAANDLGACESSAFTFSTPETSVSSSFYHSSATTSSFNHYWLMGLLLAAIHITMSVGYISCR